MNRFEYKTVMYHPGGFGGGKVDPNDFQDTLNRLGYEGWELVSCIASNAGNGYTRDIISVFKRKVL